MSVNYYMANPDGTPDESKHLGKWSAGEFTARAYPERGIVDRASWEAQLTTGPIVAEHHAPATVEKMLEMATARPRWGRSAHPRGDEIWDRGMRFLPREFC